MACNEVATILYNNLSITAIAGGFLAAAETLLQCYD
jgi:hypothetical protein